MSNEVKFISENKILSTSSFNIVKRYFSLINSKNFVKEIILSKPIVTTIPVLDNKHILLVDQYRYGVKKNLLELPAGTMKNNEAPLACAKRELEEETGYKSDFWIKFNSFYSSPGLNNELVHCFEAKKLIKTKNKLDYDEILKPVIIEEGKIKDLIINGYIKDAKTIIGLMQYFFLNNNRKNDSL
tara:strand:+ start:200 stop:754 length:555 start_codon:yes stop_codon:yes gene_type:complete